MTAAATIRRTWRCTSCGKCSNAKVKPRQHWNRERYAACGPFEAAQVAPDGAVLVAADAVTSHSPSSQVDVNDPLRYRQSTLRSYYECPRSTVLSSPLTTGTIGSSADAGSAFHAIAAEVRRTLRSPAHRLKSGEPLPNYVVGQGESQMSTQEVVEIAREVIASGPWILSPTDYMGDGDTVGLVQMVCNLADEKWLPSRFMAIEQRLSMQVVCPDGEVRLLTGTPDYVLADPGQPPGLVIGDDKTGLAKPQSPRVTPEEGQPIRGAQYLEDFMQLAIYWILGANEWPFAQRAICREKNWRWNGPPREIEFTRADLEHLIPWVGDLMMKLDRGLREGEASEYAQPRSGSKCNTRCPVVLSCPIPAEQRGAGAIVTDEAADAAAREWVRVKAKNEHLRKALKTYHEQHPQNRAAVVNETLVARWKTKASGTGRDFGVFEPAGPPKPLADVVADVGLDDDYIAAWEAELARQTALATA